MCSIVTSGSAGGHHFEVIQQTRARRETNIIEPITLGTTSALPHHHYSTPPLVHSLSILISLYII